MYKCTDYYNPNAEVSILWNDASIGIEWPNNSLPLLSNKDENALKLDEIL
ncbi:dTDP-4-keto-6-deoxyglucose 3,5-epimerase [Vibrio chagasii]|nr:dTDP-4-keto-6-deoxyglucose 3,5-epimerase [Vibrio chagasii]CAH7295958.1 dTDP-4-keto-6-deoxyglucose 3,5-epimerase [Vibrio chagasii]